MYIYLCSWVYRDIAYKSIYERMNTGRQNAYKNLPVARVVQVLTITLDNRFPINAHGLQNNTKVGPIQHQSDSQCNPTLG